MVDFVRHEPPEDDPDDAADAIRYLQAHGYKDIEKYADVLLAMACEPDQQFYMPLMHLSAASVLFEALGLEEEQKKVDAIAEKFLNEMEEYIDWLEDELYACSGKKKERPVFVLEKGHQS